MTSTPAFPFVLAFGDSLTAGYGLTRAEAFPARLEALLRARSPSASVHAAGVSGDTTADGRRRLARVLARLPQRPDLAIVELGANDALRRVPVVQTRANLDAILHELGRCGIPVLLAGMVAPPWLGAAALAFNRIYPDLAAAHGVPLDPFFLDGVALRPGHVLADGFHPNARAIAHVAQRILPAVEMALAAGRRAAA